MDYVLMNKDTPVLDFSCRRNEYGEPMFLPGDWHTEVRPIGFRSLGDFLERRKAPKHRRHIQTLLEQAGCADPEGFLQVTHALSLNDTLWVKPADSGLSWAEVSLYQNPFNEVISQAAFDGVVSSEQLSSTSPEYSTDGGYAKCWVREGQEIFLYKGGSVLYEIEPLSEYLATQVAAVVCPDSVTYDLHFYRGRAVSRCQLFTDETVGLAKAGAIFGGGRTIPELLQYFEAFGSGDAFRRMCVLDALICNPDRHYGNFGVLFSTDTMEVLRMAPVFDHNRSLFPEAETAELWEAERCLAHCRPRLGTDFLLTAGNLLTDDIRRDVRRMTEFSFTGHPSIVVEEERLAALSAIVRRQANAILER